MRKLTICKTSDGHILLMNKTSNTAVMLERNFHSWIQPHMAIMNGKFRPNLLQGLDVRTSKWLHERLGDTGRTINHWYFSIQTTEPDCIVIQHLKW